MKIQLDDLQLSFYSAAQIYFKLIFFWFAKHKSLTSHLNHNFFLLLLFLSGKTNARNMATNLHLNHTIIFGILTLYYIVRKIQYCAYPAQQWTRAHWHIKHKNKIESKRNENPLHHLSCLHYKERKLIYG